MFLSRIAIRENPDRRVLSPSTSRANCGYRMESDIPPAGSDALTP